MDQGHIYKLIYFSQSNVRVCVKYNFIDASQTLHTATTNFMVKLMVRRYQLLNTLTLYI